MYFFYFDESGTRDPRVTAQRQDGTSVALGHIYSLTAVGLLEWKWRKFDHEISSLKSELAEELYRAGHPRLDLADCEVKSNWLRNKKERAEKSRFLSALSDGDLRRLSDCFYDQIAPHRMKLFTVVVDKRYLHDHVTHDILHKKAYELLLERIEHFMREFHRNHLALMVMDDTDRNLNRAVAMKHAWLQRAGNQHLWFDHIVEYPFFTDSRLSHGVQLADLCAYNAYRAFSTENCEYSYFKRALPFYYRRASGEKLDGLKIFPENSPLVSLAQQCWQQHQKENPAIGGVKVVK